MKRLTALLLIALLPAPAIAAGPLVPSDNSGSTLDFSLRFARAEMPLEYAGRTQDGTASWFGVSLREQVSPRVTLGMYGGYAWLTQTNNPVTAGIELDGYHAGFSLHALLWPGRRASLYGTLDYGYQKMDHEGIAQKVVIDWTQAQAQLGAMLTLARHWRLYGGGSYGRIDGEERASGAVNHTLDFERGARSGGFVGLDLNVETDGYIGVEYRSGLARGGEIYFKRRF